MFNATCQACSEAQRPDPLSQTLDYSPLVAALYGVEVSVHRFASEPMSFGGGGCHMWTWPLQRPDEPGKDESKRKPLKVISDSLTHYYHYVPTDNRNMHAVTFLRSPVYIHPRQHVNRTALFKRWNLQPQRPQCKIQSRNPNPRP